MMIIKGNWRILTSCSLVISKRVVVIRREISQGKQRRRHCGTKGEIKGEIRYCGSLGRFRMDSMEWGHHLVTALVGAGGSTFCHRDTAQYVLRHEVRVDSSAWHLWRTKLGQPEVAVFFAVSSASQDFGERRQTFDSGYSLTSRWWQKILKINVWRTNGGHWKKLKSDEYAVPSSSRHKQYLPLLNIRWISHLHAKTSRDKLTLIKKILRRRLHSQTKLKIPFYG